jgi:DNA-binding response OmpR family regulator
MRSTGFRWRPSEVIAALRQGGSHADTDEPLFEPANLTVHISALRRALRGGRDGNRFIINIPGRGYRFVASIQVSMR